MARAAQELEALAKTVNSQLATALRGVLQETEDGLVSIQALRTAMGRVRAIQATGNPEKIASATLKDVNAFNARDIQRTIGVAVPELSAPIANRWRREHVRLIKTITGKPKQDFLKYLNEATQKGTRVETIQNWLRERAAVNERRARLIARDQVLTLNANLTKDRHEKAGITEYIWRSVGDGSVRSHHDDLDGQRFRYDDPPMGGGTGEDEPGNPGSGIGCRCQAIPVIPEFEE